MNKEEFSLDIDMSKADMSKLKDLLTSKLGLRHFAFQLKTGEYLDLVEYKDYEKLEKEHQRKNGCLHLEIKELKDRIDKAVEYIEKYRQIYDIDGSLEPKIDEFSILASPKYLLKLLKGDKQ